MEARSARSSSPAIMLAPLVLLAACARATTMAPATSADLAITNVAVIDAEPGRVIPNQTVLVRQGRILAVQPMASTRVAPTTRTLDAHGKFVIPGLWDMHAHFNPATALRVDMPLTLAHGVTGVRIMGADRPSAVPAQTMGLGMHRRWQAQIDSGTLTGPRILSLASWAVNGAGGISDAMPSWYKANTREEGRQLARYFKERGFDFIKVYTNISREGFLGLAEEARAIGIPLAGHEPVAMSAIEISNAGQRSIEHSRIFLFNCWAGADSMQKNLHPASARGTPMRRRMVDEYDATRCADVFRTFARNGTYITPTHVTRKMDAFADDPAFRNDPRLKYVPYPARMAWTTDANGMVAQDTSVAGRKAYMDFYRKGLTLTRDALRAGVPVMLGTDAGDTYVFHGSTVHDELEQLVSAGLTPAEALRAATVSGATYLQKTADFGTVQAGRYADLVVLDANPLERIGHTRLIHAVVFGGRVLGRATLDSMLASAEAATRLSVQERLWLAAVEGDTSAIVAALAAGARVDSLDPQGNRRALNYAAIQNRVGALRVLLARGAGLNLTNRTGFTPLHHAVEASAVEALRFLIGAGADVAISDAQGRRPMDTARRVANAEVIRLLAEAGQR